MPFKNEGKFLRKTLETILNQEVDFELIAVDDHSSDGSWELIEGIDKQFKLFKNEGRGTIDALKTAYKKSSGDFITRMDADDLMPKNKLKELKRILIAAGRGHVSTGRVEYFSDGELGAGFIKYADWLNGLCERDDHFTHIFKECVIASPNWMMYREDFEKIGGFGDSIYPEDYHLVFKMWQAGLKVVSSDCITHLWRDHAGRASRNLEVYRDQKFYDLKLDFFLKTKCDDITLWGAGPSGKKLAKKLLERRVEFRWVTGNLRKVGKFIYGVEIKLLDEVKDNVILAVTQKDASDGIVKFLKDREIDNYYFF